MCAALEDTHTEGGLAATHGLTATHGLRAGMTATQVAAPAKWRPAASRAQHRPGLVHVERRRFPLAH